MHYSIIESQNTMSKYAQLQKIFRPICNIFEFIAKPTTIGVIKTFFKEVYEDALDCIDHTIAYQNLSEKEKKNIINDMLYSYALYGYRPSDYTLYGFHSKSKEERKAYFSLLESSYYIDSCFSSATYRLFQNKGDLFELIRPFAGRDAFVLKNESQIADCVVFLSSKKEVIVKPVADYGGYGIRKVTISRGNESALAQELLQNGECLIEEMIVQSEKMAWLNQSSVNTVRLCTFMGENGLETIYVALRVGREGSLVDNFSSGGVWIPIDLNTHRTMSRSEVMSNVYHHAVHPDSGKDLSGFEIPDWDEMIALAKEATKAFPEDVHVFGWDFAHTDQGWIVVEINAYPDDEQELLGGRSAHLRELFAPFIEKKKMLNI